jgi:hypothetical protein
LVLLAHVVSPRIDTFLLNYLETAVFSTGWGRKMIPLIYPHIRFIITNVYIISYLLNWFPLNLFHNCPPNLVNYLFILFFQLQILVTLRCGTFVCSFFIIKNITFIGLVVEWKIPIYD